MSRLVSPMAHISTGETPLTASSPWLIDRWIRWFADRKRPLHYVLRLIWLLLHVLIEWVCHRGCRSPIRSKCRAVKWMVVQHSKWIFLHLLISFFNLFVILYSTTPAIGWTRFLTSVVRPPAPSSSHSQFLVCQGSTLDYFPLQFYIEYTDSFIGRRNASFNAIPIRLSFYLRNIGNDPRCRFY